MSITDWATAGDAIIRHHIHLNPFYEHSYGKFGVRVTTLRWNAWTNRSPGLEYKDDRVENGDTPIREIDNLVRAISEGEPC